MEKKYPTAHMSVLILAVFSRLGLKWLVMKTLGSVISKINLDDNRDKYLSREFQQYGMYLAEELGDMAHKALYIRMAKEVARQVLAEALSFVLDSQAKSRARLFMWKVKQLKVKKQNESV